MDDSCSNCAWFSFGWCEFFEDETDYDGWCENWEEDESDYVE